jgi:hypothetical protein
MRWGEIILLGIVSGFILAFGITLLAGWLTGMKMKDTHLVITFFISWLVTGILAGIKFYRIQDRENKRRDFI